MQVAKMHGLCRVEALSLSDRERSLDTQRECRVELLLCVKRSQLKWFGHLIRIPPGCLPLESFWAPTGRRSQDSNRTYRWNYIFHLAWDAWDPPGCAGKHCFGEGRRFSASCNHNSTQDKWKIMYIH